MTYQQTIDYLFQQFPSFKKYGSQAVKYGLYNIKQLCKGLNHPQQQFKSIHIAGTNGKGSVTHILAAIFMQAGFKTASLTSPHYKTFRERIKINGQFISKQAVVDFVKSNQPTFNELQASFFEISTAMAFWYFAKEKVDIALIETGLGGRLDSTNIIQPQLSVITNIGLDHQEMLGDTLPAIAREKAGIIKQNTPVVIGEYHTETKPVFDEVALMKKAPIFYATGMIQASIMDTSNVEHNQILIKYLTQKKELKINTDLKGVYQQKNIQTALAALSVYQTKYNLNLDDAVISQALQQVKRSTKLLGKWMILQQSPKVIADSAHNETGLKAVLHTIRNIPHQQLHIVFGMMRDKMGLLECLPLNAQYYFCAPNFKRSLTIKELKRQAQQYQLKGEAYASVVEAKNTAMKQAKNNDLILVIGSCFIVAEVI